MSLKLMYITNNPDVALIAQKYGVDRVWIDLETLGKAERQPGDSVKSDHTIDDIRKIAPLLKTSEMLVRVNPINPRSKNEIENVIAAGAQNIMLPMWKTPEEVKEFLNIINGRTKNILLLETKEAEECLDDVLKINGIDEIHIGLNDLHLSYGHTFMFEELANGRVDSIINKIKPTGIPYGFGGVARIGEGMLPAERIILEHYHLGSTGVILSRAFCNTNLITDINEIDETFKVNVKNLRDFEYNVASKATEKEFEENHKEVIKCVDEIVKRIEAKRNGTYNK